MASRTQILMSSQAYYDEVKDLAQNGEVGKWSCGKKTKDGNLLFFHIMKPQTKIVASAVASGDAFPTPDQPWPYMVRVKNVKMLKRPISLRTLQEIPAWGWPMHPRRHTYLKEPIANALLNVAKLKIEPVSEPPPKSNDAGSGFGTPEQRRVIEQAARKEFKKHFKDRGYTLVSRESEKIGYDFDARRKTQELHIEVKGISGPVTKFIITAKEAECARADGNFRLAAGTEATTKNRKVHVFTGKGFLKKFGLKPISYFAEVKHSLLA